MNDMHELNRATQATAVQASPDAAALLKSYAISAALFSGSPDALYERHLKYDNIVEPETANTRERYKAAARAVRDILSDRWLRTHKTYARENPKRIYYISIEFLIGRSLGNNVMNLLLDPIVGPSFKGDGREWWEILHEEPDAGLGNGGLGRLAACFLDSMATMQLPAMGYGLRYEHGIFQQKIRNGWQEERPDNWLAHPDPWEIVRPAESVPVTFGCSFELREGKLRMIPNKPSTLIGVPYDRPVVGYGGKTVNTLRLWSATAAHSFDFQEFSGGDFVAAIAEGLNAEVAHPRSLSGRPHAAGASAAAHAGIFSRRVFAGRRDPQVSGIEFRLAASAGEGGHSAQRHAPDSRRSRTHAHLARRSASRLGRSVGYHARNARLHQPHAASRGARALAGRVDAPPHSAPTRDHLRDQPPVSRRHSRAPSR